MRELRAAQALWIDNRNREVMMVNTDTSEKEGIIVHPLIADFSAMGGRIKPFSSSPKGIIASHLNQ